jgi:1,4-alpha-glucan branching enzyme
MTILQKARQSSTGRAGKGWYKFGDADEAVRHTDAWEHETFAEEQARWERTDPAYARICEQVRQAKKRGEEASRRADQAKAEWDARVATQRQASDDAQKAPMH